MSVRRTTAAKSAPRPAPAQRVKPLAEPTLQRAIVRRGASSKLATRPTRVRALPPARLAARVEALCRELGPQLPHIDPGDLRLIVQSLLRPIGTGRVFLLERRADGGYEF